MRTDDFFEKPYWIVDLLPKQVPAGSAGQYFAIEQYYLQPERKKILYGKYLDLILRLNCYYDIMVSEDGERWEENPDPGLLEGYLTREEPFRLNILFDSENTLIVLDGNDTYVTVYDPSAGLLDLIRGTAAAEGLFVWKPGMNPEL